MRKGKADLVLLFSYVIVWLSLLLLARCMSGCGEATRIRKTQREMRGEGKHLWKGGPHKQNKMFTGYQY